MTPPPVARRSAGRRGDAVHLDDGAARQLGGAGDHRAMGGTVIITRSCMFSVEKQQGSVHGGARVDDFTAGG